MPFGILISQGDSLGWGEYGLFSQSEFKLSEKYPHIIPIIYFSRKGEGGREEGA